jgi:hypothetical protein
LWLVPNEVAFEVPTKLRIWAMRMTITLAHDGPLADETKSEFRTLLQANLTVVIGESKGSIPQWLVPNVAGGGGLFWLPLSHLVISILGAGAVGGFIVFAKAFLSESGKRLAQKVWEREQPKTAYMLPPVLLIQVGLSPPVFAVIPLEAPDALAKCAEVFEQLIESRRDQLDRGDGVLILSLREGMWEATFVKEQEIRLP